jgi:hypothetical protein
VCWGRGGGGGSFTISRLLPFPRRTKVPVHLDAVKLVKDSVACPVIHNGDVFAYSDIARIVDATGVDGTCFSSDLRTFFFSLSFGFFSLRRQLPSRRRLLVN